MAAKTTGWAGSRNSIASSAARALAKKKPAPAVGFGAQPKPAAPTAAAPGTTTAAAPTKRVDPFATTEQAQGKIGWDLTTSNNIEDLKGQVAAANTQATYDSTVNDRNAVVGQSQNNDDMAARGIIQSSVRDAASYDIEAQRALQSGLIRDTLKNITDSAATKLEAIRVANEAYQKNYGRQMGENASAAEAKVVPADPGPAAPPKPDTAALIQQWKDRPYTESEGTNSKGQHGVWHHYPDGRTVFVAKG